MRLALLARAGLALLSLGAALSCSKPLPPVVAEKCPPQTISLSFLAAKRINPTPEGQTRPVVVRVYELKQDGRLLNATFDQVWHEDKAALADDMVKVTEVQVYPAQRVDLKVPRTDSVNHLAAVALFQTPKSRSWLSMVDLPPIPEAGKCGAAACTDDDEDCLNVSVQNPRFAFWIDDSKIDDGIEHSDDFPTPGPMKGAAP